MIGYRGRIAPSPTGLMHLGHARTFWVAYQRAVAVGGVLVLRNEDLDAQRAKAGYVDAMIEDLQWLGIRWQEGLQADGKKTGDCGPYAQSARGAFYAEAFNRLREKGAIYPCHCSRKDLLRAVQAPHAEDDDEPLYTGTCRDRVWRGEETAWRFRVPDGEAIAFDDALQGPQQFIAGRDFGDFLVMRRDGVPSYQLACVVDDAAMRITEVVRGRDLLRSAARQILLQRALSYSTPAYAHADLVVDEHGMRLAKRSDALSLRALRESGISPEEIVKQWS